MSVITAEHALSLLCEEGYIEARQRSGYFVLFKKGDFQSIQEISQKSFLTPQQSRQNNAESFPFNIMAKTIRRVILNYSDAIMTRSPNQGCMELREEICSYLARSRSIHIVPEQVVIGSGAEYLYGLIAQLFGKDNIFALESPSYEKIRKVYESFGIKCSMLTLRSDGIDSAELNSTRAAVLHTTPFNSFPSGISIGISKKHEYLAWASMADRIIIEDNYDSELTVSSKAEDTLFSMTNENNVIYLNTFSKSIAPSLRIGYMLLPEKMLEVYNKKLGFYSCTVPVLDQLVLTELIRSGDYERHINRVRRERRKELQNKKY